MMLPFAPTFTNQIPKIVAKIVRPPRNKGYRIAFVIISSPAPLKSVNARTIAATVVTAYVSKRSAAMPAQSPTLSPTLSAMTAGFRGSSSGIPASTLPTRSAPTSAAFVKMPPPTRANTEIRLPPNPRESSACTAFSEPEMADATK